MDSELQVDNSDHGHGARTLHHLFSSVQNHLMALNELSGSGCLQGESREAKGIQTEDCTKLAKVVVLKLT